MRPRTSYGACIVTCADDEVCIPLSCDLCRAELPRSAALTFEGAAYAAHFCGWGCLPAIEVLARGGLPLWPTGLLSRRRMEAGNELPRLVERIAGGLERIRRGGSAYVRLPGARHGRNPDGTR